jgi:hypothetical protein
MTVEELGPFWLSVLASTVEFSGIRLRNSATAAELRPQAPRP